MDIFSSIGMQELLMILLVAVIIVGPAKIAEYGNTMGKFTRKMKQMTTDFTIDLNKELELEKQEKNKPVTPPQDSTKKP